MGYIVVRIKCLWVCFVKCIIGFQEHETIKTQETFRNHNCQSPEKPQLRTASLNEVAI